MNGFSCPSGKMKNDHHFCAKSIHQVSHLHRNWVKETKYMIIFSSCLFYYYFFLNVFLKKDKVNDHQDPNAGLGAFALPIFFSRLIELE